jgi:hypothetical protein
MDEAQQHKIELPGGPDELVPLSQRIVTAGMTPQELAQLEVRLERGALAAYAASHQAQVMGPWTPEIPEAEMAAEIDGVLRDLQCEDYESGVRQPGEEPRVFARRVGEPEPEAEPDDFNFWRDVIGDDIVAEGVVYSAGVYTHDGEGGVRRLTPGEAMAYHASAAHDRELAAAEEQFETDRLATDRAYVATGNSDPGKAARAHRAAIASARSSLAVTQATAEARYDQELAAADAARQAEWEAECARDDEIRERQEAYEAELRAEEQAGYDARTAQAARDLAGNADDALQASDARQFSGTHQAGHEYTTQPHEGQITKASLEAGYESEPDSIVGNPAIDEYGTRFYDNGRIVTHQGEEIQPAGWGIPHKAANAARAEAAAARAQLVRDAEPGEARYSGLYEADKPKDAARVGAETAHHVVTRQADAGMTADQIDRSAENVLADRYEEPSTAVSDAFYDSYDQTANLYARELDEVNEPAPKGPGHEAA